MTALYTKLKWFTNAIRLLDEAVPEVGELRGALVAEQRLHVHVEYGWQNIQRFIAPELILVLGQERDSESWERRFIPLYVIIPELGFKAEIAGKEGPGILQDLVDDLTADELANDVSRSIGLLRRTVTRSRASNHRSKCIRLLDQLEETLPLTSV